MFKLRTTGLASALCLLAACTYGDGSENSSVFQHLSIRSNGDVVAHAHDGSDARITATGDLQIKDRTVEVGPAQRELLKSYHNDALALRNDAVATGKAGARTGLTAIGAVAGGLASGNPDSIDAKVNASASKVDLLAKAVCSDLSRLYAAQQGIVADIPAFEPYATIESHEVSGCHN